MSLPKLIYIEWQDAVVNGEWFTKEKAESWHNSVPYLIKECGWIIKEDKRAITLASRYKPEDVWTEEQLGGLQRIPKTWIFKRKEIKL